MDTLSIWVAVFSVVVAIAAVFQRNVVFKESEFRLKQWGKWEREYWMLRTSDAVDDKKYEVHLSWLPYGDECISKREEG
jgi:hypothetical protein